MVLGGHGDDMVPVRSGTLINGVGIEKFVNADRLSEIESRIRGSGAEVIKLLGTSAYNSPAASALQMAESYLNDQRKLLPCAAYLTGQYGHEGIYMGVPVIIGAGGVEQIVEMDLTDDEKAALDVSAGKVKDLVAML